MSQVLAVLEQLQKLGITPRRLENDSRRLQGGEVFVAYPGARVDGRDFIPAALARGVAAVLWERQGGRWEPHWSVPNLAVDGLQALAGELAHLVYGQPSAALRLIGVTGTNGKTSCAHWLAAALSAAGESCALIGTLGNGFPGALEDALNTTPDALALHAALARYRDAGARACAMEVSSIGLDQGRCNGARFAIALFTNLSRDHLDYHPTMAEYAAAKARLFAWPGLEAAVVNLDDAFGRQLVGETAAATRIGYTLGDAAGEHCGLVLRARRIRHEAAAVRFTLEAAGREVEVGVPLVGTYNVANLLGVSGVLLAAGLAFDALPQLLSDLHAPPGRMQRYGGESGPGGVPAAPLVVVDYAHTPDALAAALGALRPLAQARGGRLICVFGCGGDRDRGKRPLMGEVASKLADGLWLTADNPRSEDPQAIVAEIGVAGRIELDRTQAVSGAIAEADAADVILVAGKGHETYQEIAGVRHAYSDAKVVRAALARRAGEESGS